MPATVVPSEQVNDPSVSGLEKCFDPKCNEKTDSGSCDGVVGCYWCVRDYNDAPLSKKYYADINTCYGGKEGRLQFLSYCLVCKRSSSVLLLTADVTIHSGRALGSASFIREFGAFSLFVTENSLSRNVNQTEIYNLTESDQVKLVKLP